ncbi:hypothetical protein ACWEVD_05105 [Nocardia thailandica]
MPTTTSDTEPGHAPAAARPSRACRAAALTAAAAVAAAGTATWFGLRYRDLDADRGAREEARSAACAYGAVLADYDADRLDAYFAAVLDRATGDWRTEFDTTSRDLRDVLTQGRVVSRAGAVECAVGEGDRDSATAIVVIDQTIAGAGTGGTPRQGRLTVTLSLEREGGRWLVNRVRSPLPDR